jgi:probable phosphoglycerate mutase
MAETRLVLVRHGESQVTVDQIVGGHAGCTGLSPLGRKQAELLRERLARTGELSDAAALYASVMPRAIETAEIIAGAVGGGELSVRQECGVCEVHPGEADGITWDKFRARYGDHERDDHTPWAPGSESRASFTARVDGTLQELAARHAGSTVVVACHGGVVTASMTALGGLPLRLPFDLFVENTSLTEWVRRDDGDRWFLARFNDRAHLL